MPVVKLSLLRCGTCGKRYSNPARHVCRTRLDRKPRKGRTKVKPQLAFTCGTCGKATSNPLTHTCRVRTDFRRRKAAHARQSNTATRRRRNAAKRRATARTTTRAAKPRTSPSRPASPRPQVPAFGGGPDSGSAEANHDYRDCFASSRDKHGRIRHECGKYPCRVYTEGHAHGLETGRQLGHADGYGQGYTAGYSEGHRDGHRQGTTDAHDNH